MTHELNPALANCKVVFARNLSDLKINQGCVVFNAPRPLLGADLPYNDWCHGRFYAEVNLADSYAATLIQRNCDLDARIVVPVTNAEVVEMLLIDNKYAERYREHSFEEQLEMLLPKLTGIQNLPYAEAMAMLDVAQACLEADRAGTVPPLELPVGFNAGITLNMFLTGAEKDVEVSFTGSLADAAKLEGHELDVFEVQDGDLTLIPVAGQEGEQAAVFSVSYQLNLTTNAEEISLGKFTDPAAMVATAAKLQQHLAL